MVESISQEQQESNGLAIAGFVLAIVSLVFSWIPIVNWFTSFPLLDSGYCILLYRVEQSQQGCL